LEEIKRAAATFAEALRPEDRIMLVSFSGRVFVDSEFTGDRNRVLGALIQMRRGVYTRLYDALALVMTERLDLVSGRKAIVLLTDGVDTASRLADAPGTLATMGESGVPVYVIQYDTKSWMARPEPPALAISKAPAGFFNNDPDYARADRYLQELSDAGGGRIERTATTDGIRDAFLRIAEELRCQYTLCYYPADQTRDGSVRSLRVEVGRTGVKLRTRAAYRMGAKPPGGK
jgi:Ca-activated chloride channel family protein